MQSGREMLDLKTVTAVVEIALQQPVTLLDWEIDSAHDGYLHSLTGGIYSVSGTAQVGGQLKSWALILKVVLAPDEPEAESDPNYWRRELLAYQSPFLKNLSGSLRAPRCYLAQEISPTSYYLWLEAIEETVGKQWPLVRFQEVGRHLGQFNGRYLQAPLPTEPWLSRYWLRNWLSDYEDISPLIEDPKSWEHLLVKEGLPYAYRERLRRFWQEKDRLFQALDQLPQTLQHLDAYRPNLLAQGNSTVLLDWDKMGIGAIGEELGGMVPASMIWFRVNGDDAIRFGEYAYQGYLAGLREAGWQGDEALVRLGFTASASLRWLIPGLFWFRGTIDPPYVEKWQAWWKRPLPEMLTQWQKVTTYLLDLADEALASCG
jgi:hypothetical protein